MGRIIAGAQLPRDLLKDIPKRLAGLYLLYKKKGNSKVCFYIGISENLRRRLNNHEYFFDYFSCLRLSKRSREFLEPFLIAAINAFPKEKMKIYLFNEHFSTIEPQLFHGRKDLYWVETVKE